MIIRGQEMNFYWLTIDWLMLRYNPNDQWMMKQSCNHIFTHLFLLDWLNLQYILYSNIQYA